MSCHPKHACISAVPVVDCSKILVWDRVKLFSDKLTLITLVPVRSVAAGSRAGWVDSGQNTIITIYFTLYIYILPMVIITINKFNVAVITLKLVDTSEHEIFHGGF